MEEQVPVPPPTKPFPILLVLLSVLILFLLSSTLFLAYQNLQLQKQISELHLVPTPTPRPSESPPQDPTANWKTYTNIQYAYSFKYPDTLVTVQENGPTTRLMKGLGYSFEVEVIQSTGTIDAWLNKEKNNGQYPENNWSSIQSMFQNNPALLLQSAPNTMQVAMDIYLVKIGNNIYKIAFSKEPSDKVYVDQILSTFKFLNQNTQSDQSDGQRVNCPAAKAQVCPAICIHPPPYICGSDGKNYCSSCQACNTSGVSWYISQNTPCPAQ